jgi:RNA polymerase sigma factor (sigma-70 family)
MNAAMSGSNQNFPPNYFATTRWTVVLAAGSGSSPDAEQALEELCGAYWYPLYAYVRRQGCSREDAEDLVQGFFASLLARHDLEGVRPEKGKFRAFLLAALKHFLANERDRKWRQKRGGKAIQLPLDWQQADTRYQIEPADNISPDKLFDRAWAVTLLETVIARLRQEMSAGGQSKLFDHLKPFLMVGRSVVPYAQAAAELEMSAGAVRVAVHRLRRRYRELLMQEVAQTLSNPAQSEEEVRTLLGAFSD